MIDEVPILPYPIDKRITGAIAAGIHIEHKVLAAERELDDLKWFAYRFLSPYDATKLFYRLYLEKRRDYVRGNIDMGLLPKLRDRSLLQLKPSAVTQLWMARQRADEIGLPYGVYLQHAMEFWSRRSGDGYAGARAKYAPSINQLHFTDRSEAAWRIELAKIGPDLAALDAPSLAYVPELGASAFAGEPAQIDAREFIATLSRSAASWEWEVRKWCYDYPIMSLLSMRRLMPRDSMIRVISALRAFPSARRSAPIVVPDLRPSCFAISRTYSEVADKCASCRFAESCRTSSDSVLGALKAVTGHADPRRAKLRKRANARQRKFDTKKRAARIATSVEA